MNEELPSMLVEELVIAGLCIAAGLARVVPTVRDGLTFDAGATLAFFALLAGCVLAVATCIEHVRARYHGGPR